MKGLYKIYFGGTGCHDSYLG